MNASGIFPETELAKTESMCQDDTVAARIRLRLLRLESDGHRAGWDAPTNAPTLFRFEVNKSNRYVRVREATALTRMMRAICLDVTSGDVGKAINLVADWVEETALPPQGQEFYGYALRHEMWWGLAGDPSTMAAAKDRRLHQHPARRELRHVTLVARDGLTWVVCRLRNQPPQVVAVRPEGDLWFAGLVANALGRLTNAAADNPVPIPPLTGPE